MISSCSKSLQKGYIIYLGLLLNNFASFLHGKAIMEKIFTLKLLLHVPLGMCSSLKTGFIWRPFSNWSITHQNKIKEHGGNNE